MPIESATLGLINKMLWIAFTVAAEVLITYPKTRIAISIRHKKTMQAIGILWIIYNFLLAISLRDTQIIARAELAWTLRILECVIVSSLIIWGSVSLKEKIILR